MNAPVIFPGPGGRVPRTDPRRDQDSRRRLAYVVIAAVAFIAGLMLGQLGGEATRGSRIGWPFPVLRAHPQAPPP